MSYIETEKKLKAWWANVDVRLKQASLWAFAIINLAFLFHTVNFMFGDHDWYYVRGHVAWNEGTFEGRPLHFLMQYLFFDGMYFPILNNLFSFAALTVSGMLLAKYWRIPVSVANYTLFTVFVAVLPLTLVWLYYTKDTLINLSLPLICMTGILCAEKGGREHRLGWHVLAVVLLYLAFASYTAVLELIGIVILGAVLLSYVFYKESFIEAVRFRVYAVIDAVIALIVYVVCLKSMTLTSDYNTQLVPFDYLLQKISENWQVVFEQFTKPIPFMEYKFKLLLVVLCLCALAVLMYRGGIKRAVPAVFIVLAILCCSKFVYFIAEERGQILAEMENFAFVPRLDFYGLGYIYALSLAVVLSIADGRLRKAFVVLAVVIAFMSVVRDMYAEKVWKLGFDAEMKAHERIVSRLEKMPEFDAKRHYRLLQVGGLSLRKNYYREVANEAVSLDLLETSYTPEFMSHIVYNFYYPDDIFWNTATVNDLSARGREFLRYQAQVWPLMNSIFIDGDVVIIVLTEKGLNRVLSKM